MPALSKRVNTVQHHLRNIDKTPGPDKFNKVLYFFGQKPHFGSFTGSTGWDLLWGFFAYLKTGNDVFIDHDLYERRKEYRMGSNTHLQDREICTHQSTQYIMRGESIRVQDQLLQ